MKTLKHLSVQAFDCVERMTKTQRFDVDHEDPHVLVVERIRNPVYDDEFRASKAARRSSYELADSTALVSAAPESQSDQGDASIVMYLLRPRTAWLARSRFK